MTGCSTWNVISAGPSRQYLKQSDLLLGAPTVTINRAIDVVDSGIHVDFAMFADPPQHLSTIIDFQKYLVPPIQVWCPRPSIIAENGVLQLLDMPTLWEPFLGASVGIRLTETGTVEGDRPGMKRHLFALLSALERVMKFRPTKVRVLCADMMGSWAPGLSEEECEAHQSVLEQVRRQIGMTQQRINETKGRDQSAVVLRENLQKHHDELLKGGDPIKFKRWEHERKHLKGLERKALEVGCTFEWCSPKEAITA